MAISLGDINKQLWDDALTRVLDLSTATVKRNSDLEARVAELEVELSVWKQAHSQVLDVAEREKKIHDAQVTTLNRQLSSLEFLKNQNPLILCVINANENIFSKSLLSQGLQGGRQAAQELTKRIAEHLSQEEGLLETLLASGACTEEELDGFLFGFSQASPRFLTVDVGTGRDAADSKIREYIQTYTCFPQTLRLFFCSGQNLGYTPSFGALERKELLGKVVLLEGSRSIAEEIAQLALPSIKVDGLFTVENPDNESQGRPALIALPGSSKVTTHGGLISPQSETYTALPQSTNKPGAKLIDATKPLHKQIPPPCNEHYLMKCSKGANCRYSHDWLLTPDQLETLSRNAKKAPCNYLKNGLECPYGDNCCWGHFCPGGARCFHLSKGKCWFKGDGMHGTLQEA